MTKNPALQKIAEFCGLYEGAGVNHEKQPFNGRLRLSPVIGGAGLTLEFTASGNQGDIYHDEKSLITITPDQRLGLWHISSNTPFMQALMFRREESGRYIFGDGDTSDKSTFREEIHLEGKDKKYKG